SSYYKQSLSKIVEVDSKNTLLSSSATSVIICSDDISWCRSTFLSEEYPHLKFIFCTETSAIQTLCIMISCNRGGICANSTLSWWGAYLGLGKHYFLPEPWISDQSPRELYFMK